MHCCSKNTISICKVCSSSNCNLGNAKGWWTAAIYLVHIFRSTRAAKKASSLIARKWGYILQFPQMQFISNNLLEELHHPKITNKGFVFDSTESSSSGQGHEFMFGPFFPSWVLSHHQHIKLRDRSRSRACLGGDWKNWFHNDHLPIIWNSFVAVLQQLQAVIITPVMKYPLQNVHISRR